MKKKMGVLYLIKFLYFAERRCLREHNFPIVGGHYYSLPNGPVVSQILDSLKSESLQGNNTFSRYFRRVSKDIILKEEKSLAKLSQVELKIYDQVYMDLYDYSPKELVGYCHDQELVPEWVNPGESSVQIEPGTLLKILGKSSEEIQQIAEMLAESRSIAAFSRKYEA